MALAIVVSVYRLVKIWNSPQSPAGSPVRNDKEVHGVVHGIMILGTECKISQYADDTTMILDFSQSKVKGRPLGY